MTEIVSTFSPGNVLRKYPIFVFILLTFLISHLVNPVVVEIVSILFPAFSFSFPLSGLDEKSILTQYGGTLAAVFVVTRLYGVSGLRSTLSYSRLNLENAPWLAISFLLPLSLILISYNAAGVDLDALLNILSDHWQLYLLVIGGFIISAGLAEEYGWRGFLLPQLLRSRSPLTATFIVFIVLSVWHFPALIAGWKGEPIVPWLILSFPVAVIHSWLFFKSKGNLIVVVVYHACFDAQYSFFSNFISTTALEHQPFHQGWTFIALHCVIALAIIIATKGKLGFDATELSIDEYFGTRNKRLEPIPE